MTENREEILNEIFRVQRLKDEGKKVDILLKKLEEKLFEICDNQVDGKKNDEKN